MRRGYFCIYSPPGLAVTVHIIIYDRAKQNKTIYTNVAKLGEADRNHYFREREHS
jgi:hypothetical protein